MRSRWIAALFSSLLMIPALPAAEGAGPIRKVEWSGVELFGGGRPAGIGYLLQGFALSDSLLSAEMSRIDSLYFSLGYLSVEASVDTTMRGGGVEVRIDIHEGRQAVIGDISIGGSAVLSEEETMKRLGALPGGLFDPRALEKGMASLLSYYNDTGYPFAQVWMTGFRFDRGSNTVELSFSIYEGKAAHISGISFEGISRTDSTVARRISRIGRGDEFRERDLARAREYLLNSGLFVTVSPVRVMRRSEDLVDLVIPVKEREKSNAAQGAFGFSQKEDGDYRINGALRLELVNIAGKGRDIRFDWLNDGLKYSRTEVLYTEPFFLSSPVHLDAELRQTVHDTLYDMVSAGIYSRIPVGPSYSLITGAAGERTVFGDGGDLLRTSRQRYRLGLKRDAGSRFRLEMHLEGAWKNSYYGGGMSESEWQLLYHFDASAEREVFGRQAVYCRLVSQGVFSRSEVPLSEMYPLGGARTLRGYRENQFRGERIDYLNIEYRFGGESRIFIFDDAGAFYRPGEGWQVKNGFGFGLRSSSQLGTVELSFGVGDKFSLEGTRIHISLIERF